MNAKIKHSRSIPVAQAVVLALMIVAAPLTQAAPILWTGSSIAFSQTVASSNSVDVLITNVVSLTRNNNKGLYNPAGGDTKAGVNAPTDTRWAFATNSPITSLTQVTNLTYNTFDSYRNGDLSGVLLPNKQMVVHLLNEDIYIPVMFTAWPHGGGPFAYIRSTPAAVLPDPTVTITSPANGAVFASPVSVTIEVSAAVAIGSVTNVAFLANGLLLGDDQNDPFSITTGSLASDSYALTAVATAGGVSSTSAAVNITVVSPVTLSLSSPAVASGQFAFDYTANPGLSYVVQNSSNLVEWLSIVTNVAASNPVHFTDGFIPGGFLFYRVGRLPNP